MEMAKIKEIVAAMTLEEKAGMCSGEDFWHTKAVERLGIPKIMVSDGPHGLRKQDENGDNPGVNDSIKAVCFPAGCGAATSFNRDLIYEMGKSLGKECQSENVSVLLGPAVNIKRSPLCGRNFEYYSEDPYLASEIAASHINGVQSMGVGTSIKHFMANNQETRRMSVSASIDERTLHEIYLAVFENAIKKSKPWTVMSSYNKVNGRYVGENHELMTDFLRKESGFDGFVMSDWGAVGNRVAGVKAGLDLEMPGSQGVRDALIVEAVKNGTMEESALDTACERILNIVYRAVENHDSSIKVSWDDEHDKSRMIAEETIVLLKNQDDILPLSMDKKIAFIGKYAVKPRFQGGGSSHIDCIKVTSAMDEVMSQNIDCVTYAQGFDDAEDVIDDKLEAQAVKLAKESDIAVIFAGLPDAFESEGFDRKHMHMPQSQNHLISEIAKVQPNVVVVLHNGSPVEMPWIDDVKGVLESYLGGEAVGGAQCDILFGKVNPSAKLAETFPYKLEDNPSFLTGFGDGDAVSYSEGLFVGYRYYDKKKMPVQFSFGYGLSYTTFKYSNLVLSGTTMNDDSRIEVSVDVTNTGKTAGKEIVQIYVADMEPTVTRPEKELKNFTKVFLEPGQTKTVTMELDMRAFAYYEPRIKGWFAHGGKYRIMAAKSSAEIELVSEIEYIQDKKLPVHYTVDTTMGDIFKDDNARAVVSHLYQAYFEGELGPQSDGAIEAISNEMNDSMLENLPIHAVTSFAKTPITQAEIEEAVDKLNNL